MQQPEKYLSEKAVCDRVGVSRCTLWRWQQEGTFPKRRQIGPRRVAWLESELNTWFASRPEV
ncbi:AlpA family phage regulatory protein [Pseudomonas aeruginosa]|uniref:helix-turn-helix transcriptional regulator n=1 Tax=Pseudomonas aeruginosa group TaxID=136841 RepID=UPI0009A7ACAE|nr:MULTISPECIES: AlpA family phage regulatory protein [Pseudomonas aeruginosa group]EMB4117870.1 AlpA family phage regulatory protein [Pseudomonas aeruginosa]MDI3608144.1 AlpA family phage regulatory protein [Pseudomonas aeruginosa]MDI3674891.1 AlpA family phage regulatory protein [Pseudomonas aeruginosa]MDI3705433.1 AlpA family phage regulatory protein [Pseudomonas aeruginosa]MDI3759529.1 AlpA family phage regulatory protein [Pseudomonas aeruginosa]